MIDLHVSLR